MKTYNNYSSACNQCWAKGWHEKPTPCTRMYSNRCGECHQSVEGVHKCGGTNVLIDYSNIAKAFISAYESGQRIKVQFSYGEVKSGTVSMTTGLKPVFILMLRSNSIGSSYTLSDKDIII